MDDQLLDSLMYRSEDSSLDFKQAQYVFSRKDVPSQLDKQQAAAYLENKKSELLKDMLAMANSWRDGPGYILLGVREARGGLPEVVGIPAEDMHDDAHFQQFIAVRVNAPLAFSYACRPYRGAVIGVISVPAKQQRPFYAKERFGGVEAGVVYVRRGSSTVVARPEEVATMGVSNLQLAAPPNVAIDLMAEAGGRLADAKIEVCVPDFGAAICDLPDFKFAATAFLPPLANSNFIRELAEDIRTTKQGVGVLAVLENLSGFAITELELHVQARQQDVALSLQEGGTTVDAPSDTLFRFETHASQAPSIEIRRQDGRDTAVVHIARILPRQRRAAADHFCIFPVRNGPMVVTTKLFATELPEPIKFEVELDVVAELEAWPVERLLKEHETASD